MLRLDGYVEEGMEENDNMEDVASGKERVGEEEEDEESELHDSEYSFNS